VSVRERERERARERESESELTDVMRQYTITRSLFIAVNALGDLLRSYAYVLGLLKRRAMRFSLTFNVLFHSFPRSAV
jgi:hypothetical protein